MSPVAAVLRRLGHQRWFARLGRAYVPLDTALGKLTRGRFVALSGRSLPSLLLTTTGRRTGQARTVPLLYAPDGDAFVVIGSNWGQRHQPAWSGNLLATPEATVTVGGRVVAVRARQVTGDERDDLFERLLGVWPAYHTYQTRAGDRELRVFRLEPADA